jgi:hypothetical protein
MTTNATAAAIRNSGSRTRTAVRSPDAGALVHSAHAGTGDMVEPSRAHDQVMAYNPPACE